MKKNIYLIFGILLFMSFVSADAFSGSTLSSSFSSVNTIQMSNPSLNQLYSGSAISTYWPQLSSSIQNQQCENYQDFLITIPPAGCTPAVVRSDLLAEQNVPVMCQLISAKVNPLIDVSNIKSISFQGQYPADVSAVSYYPARAALRSDKTLVSSPVVNNIGYVTIVLKRQQNESAMPKNVSGNLTATINYDAQKAFGVGSAEFYLKTLDDNEWGYKYTDSSFWMGRGYLRLVDVEGNSARIALYSDANTIFNEVTLKEGDTSGKIYFPGFYCQAGVRVHLDSITSDADSALLDIDGNSVEVRQGSRVLNDRCTVSSLVMGSAGTGKVELRCSGVKNTISLSLVSGQLANVTLNGVDKNVGVSDSVATGSATGSKNSYNWYLAYSGNAQKQVTDKLKIGESFVVLVGERDVGKEVNPNVYSNLAIGINSLFSRNDLLSQKNFETGVAGSAGSSYKLGENLIVLYQGVPDSGLNLKFNNIVDANGQSSVSISGVDSTLIGTYYNKAGDSLDKLLDNYPQETSWGSSNNFTLGEQALLSYKILSNTLIPSQIATPFGVSNLLNKFLQLYPTSSAAGNIRTELGSGSTYDTSNAIQTVYIDSDYHTITLKQMKAADSSMKSAELNINGRFYGTVHENDRVNLSSGAKDDYIYVKKIYRSGSVNYVDLTLYRDSSTSGNYNSQGTYSINENTPREVNTGSSASGGSGDYTFSVNNIKIDEVAQVSLIPEMTTKTVANFTYNIGIEQRTIQIAPEKANETANKLNKTIQQWEDKNAKLGQLVESWKGACLATSAVLQIKTLLTGFGGASTARTEVMKVYRDECKSTSASSGLTSSECYSKLSDAIDSDVKAYADAINAVNDNVAGKSTVTQWNNDRGKNKTIGYTNKNYPSINLNTGDLATWDDVKAYLLNEYIAGSTASTELRNQILDKRNTQLDPIIKYKSSVAGQKAQQDKLTKLGVGSAQIVTLRSQDSVSESWSGKYLKDVGGTAKLSSPISGITDNTPVQFVDFNGLYLLTLIDSSSDSLAVGNVLYVDSTSGNYGQATVAGRNSPASGEGSISFNDYTNLRKYHFIKTSQSVCSNKYLNDPKTVEFYETGSSKGMPAKVPFDPNEGWYVKVSDSSGGILSDSQKGYQSNGAVSYYTICNVGANGIENSDDDCQGFDVNTDPISSQSQFCGLSGAKLKTLMTDALSAIKQAQNNYGKASFVIKVGGRAEIKVNSAISTSTNGAECEDFMSPEDCNIMYNVCDPVICPASRCDFGGKYPVADVIQSGVFGSLFLCLPNFGSPSDGKVIVPICLTGVHAGIEGWISILKAEQKCMQTAAKTGKYTGICDEMTAVYKCEFFWRQAQPLMNSLVPKLAEGLYSGFSSTKKGGGEYLTFQNAWDNMQKSIDYFKNTYASTSFTAVKFGNVAEIGSAFCKGFVGTSVPTSAKAVDSLLKAESPTQFYAQFSEISLTDATIPPTSQYKVYYHIYAGKDQGVSYQIYLKSPPSSSYYYTSQQVVVDTGYVSPDDNVDNAKDFSAPAGYKELCVVINGQENCGFKQVTSDFGLSALHDTYALNQATANATSEKTCVSGTSSVLGLANLNIQAGAEEAINPSVNLRGVVRVCATNNPGTGVELNRWLNVGSCGNGMTCWLDNNSLNSNTLEVLRNTVDISNAQNALDNGIRTLTADESGQTLEKVGLDIEKLQFEDSEKTTSKIEEKIKPLLDNLTNVENNGFNDQYKAKAMYLKFELYNKVVTELTKKIPINNDPNKGIDAKPSPTSPTSEDEIIMLAKMMQGEEGNQGEEAMRAVGYVAMNRWAYVQESAAFRVSKGASLSEVISAENQFQGYSPVNDYSKSINIAREVYSNFNVPVNYVGYYFFGNDNGKVPVKTNMILCKQKTSGFDYMQVSGTNLYLSNGDYMATDKTKCAIPANAVIAAGLPSSSSTSNVDGSVSPPTSGINSYIVNSGVGTIRALIGEYNLLRNGEITNFYFSTSTFESGKNYKIYYSRTGINPAVYTVSPGTNPVAIQGVVFNFNNNEDKQVYDDLVNYKFDASGFFVKTDPTLSEDSSSCPAPAVIDSQLEQLDIVTTNYLEQIDAKTNLISEATANGCYLVSPDVVTTNTIIGTTNSATGVNSCTNEEKKSISTRMQYLNAKFDELRASSSTNRAQIDEFLKEWDACISAEAKPSIDSPNSPEMVALNTRIKDDKDFMQKKISEYDALVEGDKRLADGKITGEAFSGLGAELDKGRTQLASILGGTTNTQIVVADSVVSEITTTNALSYTKNSDEIASLKKLLSDYSVLDSMNLYNSKKQIYTKLHQKLKDRYGSEIGW